MLIKNVLLHFTILGIHQAYKSKPGYLIFCIFYYLMLNFLKNLPDGELNPGLPRDRRGYSPLYYRGLDTVSQLLACVRKSTYIILNFI